MKKCDFCSEECEKYNIITHPLFTRDENGKLIPIGHANAVKCFECESAK